MRRSSFKRPKMVLIFNGAQILVAITRSLHSAAELTKGNLQAISFCCTGKYICSGGFYFRQLQDYDSLCGEKRTYYSVRQMAHKRTLREKKGKQENRNTNEDKDS